MRRIRKDEAERIAREKEEETKKLEAERIAREKAEETKRIEAERIEKQKVEEDRIKKERLLVDNERQKKSSEPLRRINDGAKKRLDIDDNIERDMTRKSASRKSESDRNSGDFSRYKSVISPTMDMSSFKESSRDSNLGGHKTPDLYKYDTISPTFDGRTRNISGDYREAVEKSLATSQNLMSVVTGSLVPKQEQTKSRPPAQVQPKQAKKVAPDSQEKREEMQKKMEMEKKKVAGAVSDIMIKEVGSNWVSLCWKKPPISRGSPVVTYKVESWLCGEGAFWVELGRTPIPQYDAFNLKPNKCYHFRVTARNKSGWGESIMTTHKVDLNRPTQMPVISSSLDPVIKALKGSSVRLSVQVELSHVAIVVSRYSDQSPGVG